MVGMMMIIILVITLLISFVCWLDNREPDY